jgi:hypothetical protein
MKHLRASLPAAMAAAMVLGAALQPAAAAPRPGEHYIVDDRCVTVTEVQDEQVYYEWLEGNASGRGNLPADWLGEACDGGAGGLAGGLAEQPAEQPAGLPPAHAAAPAERPQPMAPAWEQAAPAPSRDRPASAAPASAAPASAAPASDFARDILATHNRLRCLHGAPPLQWNDAVADYAQRWAEQLARTSTLDHSDSYHSPVGPLGENLAQGYATGSAATQAWYDESIETNGGRGYDYQRVEQDGMSGHFTAMIWQGVRELGCARVGTIVVCNYAAGPSPAGCALPNFNMDTCALQAVRPVSRSAQACR